MTARLSTTWLLAALGVVLTAGGCRPRDGGEATPAPSPTAAQAAASRPAAPSAA